MRTITVAGEPNETREENVEIRERAHEVLDRLMDRADGVPGAFGVLGIEVPFQNGYLQSVEERFSQRHR